MTTPTCHIGVDVGGTSVRVLAEPDGRPRGSVVTAPVPDTYPDFLDLLVRLAAAATPGPLAAVGVGLPGTSEDGHARFVPALPWIQGRPVGPDLARRLGAPVRVGVDGHLTLLAEASEGAARGLRSAVLVAVGTGVGGAVLLDGRIWRGHQGAAGSFGWLPAPGATQPPDPAHGPLEQVASGQALAALAAGMDPPCAPADLLDAARAGHQPARAQLAAYADRLGRGLAALASILDPEVILVGGGVSQAMDVLEPLLAPRVAAHASPAGRQVPVRACALGPHAGVVGALRAARLGEAGWL